MILQLTKTTRNIPPLQYTGRLTFRGTLEPLEAKTVQPRVCITHPGEYGLGHWSLETQVLETSRTEGSESVRHRYQQEPSPDDRSSILFCNVDSVGV
jgi:hypothetical protein